MSKNLGQLEFDFGSFGRLKVDKKGLENSIGDTIDMVVKSSSDECNAAITQVYIDSERVEDTKQESFQEDYTPEQILERRQGLLEKRKFFVQTVLDAVYLQYKIKIDELIALEPKWQSLLDSNFETVKRWGTARFIKQIVRDDEKLKELLKIKVDIDGSIKAINDLPYIKSFLARCRVGEDRLLGVQSLKGDENGEIAALHFRKIQAALEYYKTEVFKNSKRSVNGIEISLNNTLANRNLRTQTAVSLDSITDLESFRDWLETNFSLDQVSIKNSDENILFCVFVSSLRKIVGRNMLPNKTNITELYKSLLSGIFIPKSLQSSPFNIESLDTNFCEYRDCLWESYLNTPDFFSKYSSYYFWLKAAPESKDLKESSLRAVWEMIPAEFKSNRKWSKIELPLKQADKLFTVFEEVCKKWDGNEGAKTHFFAQYPSYYFWLKNAPEAEGLKKSHLGHVWGVIPDELRSDGRNDYRWSKINLSFEDAYKLDGVFKEVQKSWEGNTEAKAQFFKNYPSYYFWLKNAPEAEGLKQMNLGQVWGIIPDEFREEWSKIDLPFDDADKLYIALNEVRKSWDGNEEAKAQFFTKYPSYYLWLKAVAEKQGLKKSHLVHIWGVIPDYFRDQWTQINLPFEYANKLNEVFEEVQKSWAGNEDAKTQFFKDYPSYYFWLKNASEAEDLKNIHLGHLWGMIPDDFREEWSKINLPFEYANKLNEVFEEVQKSWEGYTGKKEQFFAKYPSYYFWFKNSEEAKDLDNSYLGNVWGMIPDEFREEWSYTDLSFKDADKLYAEILDDSKTWCFNNSRAYMQHFSQTNLNFAFYWGLIPTSLRQKFNLEYYHPGKIDYNGIKVDSKQEFAVLRVFEEVLGYEPEVGMNFQVEVDSNTRHTFDFKVEYQENNTHVTHFFEWHPVVVSMSGGRNDVKKLEDYEGLCELLNDETYSDKDALIYAEEQIEKQYYNKRFELLTNKTTNAFRGDVRLTCATAGNRTGGLKKNLETLHEFLQQAKPDFDLSLEDLTSMFKRYLNEVLEYEVGLVERVN